VSSPEFSFALEGRESAISHDLLRDLMDQVFGCVGCGPLAAEALTGIQAALEAAPGPDAPLSLTFRAHEGHLHVALSSGGREIWVTSCATAC
jgi:hypothetical protein